MIERIIITSLLTIGYCCTFWPDMIFEKIGNWLEAHLPEWINKPTWQCYICTCFWLGTALYWLALPYCAMYIQYHGNVFEWLLTVIPAMGLNAVISEFTNKTKEVELVEGKEEKTGDFDLVYTVPKLNLESANKFQSNITSGDGVALRAQCPSCGLWQQCEYGFSGSALCYKCETVIARKPTEDK